MENNKECQLIRLNKVNELLAFIVDVDKERHNPFFGHKEDNGTITVGKFIFNEKGTLKYVDAYTKRILSLRDNSTQFTYHCSEGGTGQQIIRQLGKFIMSGEQGFLNDYKEVWGFTYENTMKVRQKALDIGFIDSTDYPYKRWGN